MRKIFVYIACFTLAFFSFNNSAAEDGAAEERHQQTAEAFNKAYRESQNLAMERKFTDAAAAAAIALELSKPAGASKEERANLTFNYGFLLLQSKQYDSACKILDSAASDYSEIYGKKSPKLINPLNELADCLANNYSDREKSLRTYKRIMKIVGSHYGNQSEQYGLALFRSGQTMIIKLANKDGKKHLEESLEIFTNLKGPHSTEAIAAQFNLAKYNLAAKKYDVAIGQFNEILAGFDDAAAPDTRLELSVHGFLVEAYEQDKQPAEATKHCLAIGKMTPEREIQDYIPLFKPQPVYPNSALVARKEASVIVEFTVDEQGFVQDPVVLDREGSLVFDKPSLAVVKRFRYAPAFVDGKAVITKGVKNRIVYEIAKR
jgi:TonB family protein